MARKSRRAAGMESAVRERKAVTAVYKAALYARLSAEREANRERDTAGTQIELMKVFVNETDDIEIYDEYCDKSVSGTTFDRPEFDRMMDDIKAGRVNCVIVKDLSRLGRDHVETGNFIERVFPFLGVRFIAVTDNFDSEKKSVDLTIPLKNIINECYAKDISRKTITARDNAWKQGKYVTGNYSYGFMKNPEDKYHLIVDREAAEVVRRVFKSFLDGWTYSDIAKELTAEHIPSPDEHKLMQRGKLSGEPKGIWNSTEIKLILQNRAYIGDIVYGRERRELYRGIKFHKVDKKDWQIIENGHEAVIGREDFEKVQIMVQEIEEQWKNTQGRHRGEVSSKNFYGNKIVCADCGARLHLRKQRSRYAFICMTYFSKGKAACLSHRVYKEDVDQAVMAVIHQHMKLCIDVERSVRTLNGKSHNVKQFQLLSYEILKRQKKRQQFADRKGELYEDYTERLITIDEYNSYNDNYSKEIEALDREIGRLLEEKERYSQSYKVDEDWKSTVYRYLNKRKLTQEVADAFVRKVVVDKEGNCEVHLFYDDMLSELLEIERERKDAA